MTFENFLDKISNSENLKPTYLEAIKKFEDFLQNNNFYHNGGEKEKVNSILIKETNWKYDTLNKKIYNYNDYLRTKYSFLYKYKLENFSIDHLKILKEAVLLKGDNLLYAINMAYGPRALSAAIEKLIKWKEEFNKEKKMEYQRIIYGAPGTGKSYMLEQESQAEFQDITIKKDFLIISEDEDIEVNNKRYWAVGAFWDSENKLEDFTDNNYWENGWDDKFLDRVNEIRVGDYIAIKSSFTTKVNGIYTSTVRIKALGIVTKESNNGKVIKVDWKLKNLADTYVGVSIRPTIQEITGNYLKIFTPLLHLENINSNSLETMEIKLKTVERVTFYDGYTYGQFVGTYKPVPSEMNSENIVYKYIPGPFMTSLVKALQNPEHKFLLIIEEINRAKADRVFGNIFQLLDRDKDGKSQYPIAISLELEKYLKEQFDDEYQNLFSNGLSLPNNFYIWTTMNNADQGVYPLDTAFKRRWSFEYIGLDDNSDSFGEDNVEYCIDLKSDKSNEELETKVTWKAFRESLNELLSENGIFEDRLIAPFFIKPEDFSKDIHNEINSDDKDVFWINESAYLNKLLMYIFDDVLKHKKSVKMKIFNESITSFSKLVKEYKSGNNIFTEDFTNNLKDEKNDK
ncbi:MAG: hypothetical protein ACRCZ2_14160 [Fusobacteriaceae bacterium]